MLELCADYKLLGTSEIHGICFFGAFAAKIGAAAS
jgi:hypothetical protein